MPTVLVADDEFGILLALELVLTEAGYRVVTAGNGKQALELASAEKPDVLLLDWMMPLMDGPSLLAAMQADPALSAIPFIIMSGAPENSLRDRLDGHVGFLHKPFHEDEVLRLINRALVGGS